MAPRIADPGALKALREKARADVDLREGPKELKITVHLGTCGIASGARDVFSALVKELAGAGITNVTLRQSGCAGLCEQEPMITVRDASDTPYRYGLLDDAKVKTIVTEHLVGGQPVDALLIGS